MNAALVQRLRERAEQARRVAENPAVAPFFRRSHARRAELLAIEVHELTHNSGFLEDVNVANQHAHTPRHGLVYPERSLES